MGLWGGSNPSHPVLSFRSSLFISKGYLNAVLRRFSGDGPAARYSIGEESNSGMAWKWLLWL